MVRDKAVLSQVARLCPGLVELVTGALQGEYTLARIEMPALDHLEVSGDTHCARLHLCAQYKFFKNQK